MSLFISSIHRSLGLPLFLFPLNLSCSALCGILSIVILSTCPNHWRLCWTTLSSRVVWLPKACLMSSFLSLCSNPCDPLKPTHFCCKNSFLILFSHCPTFQSLQENRLYHHLIYILSWFPLLLLCSSISWSSFQMLVKCIQFLFVCLFHCCHLRSLALLGRPTVRLARYFLLGC